MDMAGENTNVELQKGSENPVNHQAPHMSSDWQIHENNLTNTSIATIPTCNPTVENSFCPLIWDQPINCQSSAYCGVNVPNGTILKGNMFLPSVSGMGTQSLPHLLADSGFVERAARFSCFGGGNLVEMMNPFSVPNSMGLVQGENSLFLGTSEVARKEAFENEKKSENLHEESDKAEFSEEEGFGSKKRKRVTKGDEHDENNEAPHDFNDCAAEIKKNEDGKGTSASKNGGKSVKQGTQGADQSKEEYIHVRARRGQATNSHSLAERVRREKISERMKLLQDLVPGCSKVTGKAVMLDEIINYVQSLQRQVEFLSMKLATVNPCMDFNIEALIAKDMLQNRAHILTSSLAFPPNTTMPFPPLHASRPALIQPRLINNPCEIIQRPITLQSDAVSQVPGIWEDEFHNVNTGFNSGEPNNSQGLSDSLPPPHLKSEP